MLHTVINAQKFKCIAIHYKSSGGQYCIDLMNALSPTVFWVLVLKFVKPLDISDMGPQGLNICNLDTTQYRRYRRLQMFKPWGIASIHIALLQEEKGKGKIDWIDVTTNDLIHILDIHLLAKKKDTSS